MYTPSTYLFTDERNINYETAVFCPEDGYTYIVKTTDVPTESKRDDTIAVPDGEPMSTIEPDEAPRPDDDTDWQTRFFQLQTENDQLQAKAEHYKVLLERAMCVIAKMKKHQHANVA